MDITKSSKILFKLFSLLFLFTQCTSVEQFKQSEFDKIQTGFTIPKDDNTLWCYWYWIGDDISKDGITKDLEAMKAAGIGGALIGNINPEEKDGKIPILSEDWWGHMVHAVNQGKRIGVDIGVFNCPGWSQSGGPWVKPEMAMRHMIYSERKVKGGKKIDIKLTKPSNQFQDSYVLAFPSISFEKKTISKKNTKIKITPNTENASNLIDGDTLSTVSFSREIKKHEIEFESSESINARSIKVVPSKDIINAKIEVFAYLDDKYKSIKSFDINRTSIHPNVGPDKYAPILVSLPESKSKNFKVIISVLPPVFQVELPPKNKLRSWRIAEITISEAAGLEEYAKKTLGKMHPTPYPSWDSYVWEPQPKLNDNALKISTDKIIDISNLMDTDGNLSWNAPAGEWTIQRYGMAPTGTTNAPSAPQGKGYEIDKVNKRLVQFHYQQYVGELLKRIPEESKDAFKYVIADSYEMGSQNWTDGYEQRFEKKFGYNPKKYLPVFSGRIVGSVEESERFLWDLRRSIADDIAYEYVGGLKESSNNDNLKLWLENYGHWGFPSEFLMYGGQSDLVSGEFWNEGTLGDIECKAASSAAHIYGKPMVSAEAFTAGGRSYVRHPALLKKRGDWSFTEGINHFVLHLYIHQPDDNRVPGVNAWFSTEFNRHNTWFKKSKTYFDYLRRSQHLLQQGKYVADVCYFIGENTPIMTGVRNPELPDGYSYDYINAEVILNRVTVKDGKFVLPDGMSYNLMVLPPFETMRPELLTKIESLVKQGGKIFGKAPNKSPSLQNYPENDRIVSELANKMWGVNDNEKLKKYGQGVIIDGLELKDALNQLSIAKDVDLNVDVPVLWTHRTMPGMEIYFLTNQSSQTINFTPSFRVKGMKPQLWDAVTGEIRQLSEFVEKDGRIDVPINMKENQSWFVIFSNLDNETIKRGYPTNFPKFNTVKTLENEWEVDFKNKNIGPSESVKFTKLTDWIKSENNKIKYYSGTAVYTSKFNYSKEDGMKDVYIDLGKVGVMASVKINGKDIGTTWIAPFKLNASQAIKEGENNIEVEVVNVWRNRITGDKSLPEEKKSTWLLVDIISPDEELIPSGLLGQVTIQTIDY
jgi:hypothetical protein